MEKKLVVSFTDYADFDNEKKVKASVFVALTRAKENLVICLN